MSEQESFYCILQSQYRGQVRNIGVLLYDSPGTQLWIRCTKDYSFILEEEEAEFFAMVAADLVTKASEQEDPLRIIEYFEDTLSNALLISRRFVVAGRPIEQDLDKIFGHYVQEKS